MIVTLEQSFLPSDATGDQAHSLLGWPSHILHEKAQQYYWEGLGILSVKMFLKGQALYTAGGGRYLVDSSCYLVLNHGRPYSIHIDSESEAESFCVFFEKKFAEDVCRSLAADADKLLNEPEPIKSSLPNFFERTYPRDDLLSPALFRLCESLSARRSDQNWLEEQLHGVLQRLLQVHNEAYRDVESLPAMRAATREELYRRLHRAREYISASFSEPLSLRDMAKVACLSPNHFLRTFKQAFRQTPHQYLTARRLEQAQKLLTHTDCSVTDICFCVGFESLGSFSSLFRQRVGTSPKNYRLRKR